MCVWMHVCRYFLDILLKFYWPFYYNKLKTGKALDINAYLYFPYIKQNIN